MRGFSQKCRPVGSGYVAENGHAVVQAEGRKGQEINRGRAYVKPGIRKEARKLTRGGKCQVAELVDVE